MSTRRLSEEISRRFTARMAEARGVRTKAAAPPSAPASRDDRDREARAAAARARKDGEWRDFGEFAQAIARSAVAAKSD